MFLNGKKCLLSFPSKGSCYRSVVIKFFFNGEGKVSDPFDKLITARSLSPEKYKGMIYQVCQRMKCLRDVLENILKGFKYLGTILLNLPSTRFKKYL